MLNRISNLDSLIEQLSNGSKEEYKAIGVTLDLPLSELLPYTFWSDKHYTRNCIDKTNDFELILLCWEPGQETSVHCHGGEECWVYMIDGELEESHYKYENDILEKVNTDKLLSGAKSFMSDEIGYHKLVNNTSNRAISLHLYMDPINTCTVYDENLKRFKPITLAYHSYKGSLETVGV